MTPVVRVLGPLQVDGPRGAVVIGSARQRRLLVALATDPGRVWTATQLVDLVWSDPPADPAGALQTNVSRLRRALPAGVRIETAADGYRLDAPRAAVDVTAFADLLATATGAERSDRPDRYARALALWRGRPFDELDHPLLEPEIARLTELRTATIEWYAASLLAAGRAQEAVPVLEELVTAEPLREGAVALLMRALAAAGRQSEALLAGARLRSRLAEDMGLDPGPAVREAERQVLRQQVSAAHGGPAGPAGPPDDRSGRPGGPTLPISSFVGRSAELGTIATALIESRAVTLCGPGGVGKTRLALHAGAAVADRYPDGVVVVELGRGGPGDVVPAVAAALRVGAGEGGFVERIVDVLAVRHQLIVLDNCEHVAEETALLVEAIVHGAPRVDLLMTSREPIRVDGERVVVVTPLAPDAAAALLGDRLVAAGGTLPGDADAGGDGDGDGPILADLCRRLDGLPLALELAAGRAATLGLTGLLDAISADETLGVLRGGRRTAARRHRSVTDVVAWSYGLLDEQQRLLFEQLSVFAGPVEPAAIATVCGGVSVLPDLVERSMVVRRPGRPDRYGMLETLRAFGRMRLARTADGGRLRDRHAAWFVRVAAEIADQRRGPAEAAAVRRFDLHGADLRRAHAWLCERGALADALAMSVLFGELASLRGRMDLLVPVTEALEVAGVPPPSDGPQRPAAAMTPRLLGLLATADWQLGDLESSLARGRQAIGVAEASGDPLGARFGYEAMSNAMSFTGDLPTALEYGRRALDLSLAARDADCRFLALVDLVTNAGYAGHPQAAEWEAQLVATPARSPTAIAWREYVLGEVRAHRGDPAAAAHLEAAVAAAESVDSAFIAGVARHTLLTTSARHEDAGTALPAFGALLDHWHGLGAWTQVWIAVRALVEALSRIGRHADAAVLLGALDASPRATPVYGADAARVDAVREAARVALGAAAFDDATGRGARLGDQNALAFARGATRSASGS